MARRTIESSSEEQSDGNDDFLDQDEESEDDSEDFLSDDDSDMDDFATTKPKSSKEEPKRPKPAPPAKPKPAAKTPANPGPKTSAKTPADAVVSKPAAKTPAVPKAAKGCVPEATSIKAPLQPMAANAPGSRKAASKPAPNASACIPDHSVTTQGEACKYILAYLEAVCARAARCVLSQACCRITDHSTHK